VGGDFIPVDGKPAPVTFDKAFPYVPTRTWRIADLNNPILQAWTREALKKNNEVIQAGGTGYNRSVSCWPMGVPAFLFDRNEPVYFVQTPKEVVMIWEEDQQTRHVYLDVPHSSNPRLSWYGESVGHYENGDTLVVDTIGLNEKTFVDNYRTPHTAQLHVVERFRLVDNGQAIEVSVHVDDPGTFTQSWDAIQRYRRVDRGPMMESPCADNNAAIVSRDYEPIPQADKPDF